VLRPRCRIDPGWAEGRTCGMFGMGLAMSTWRVFSGFVGGCTGGVRGHRDRPPVTGTSFGQRDATHRFRAISIIDTQSPVFAA
jgi:hypothetical protein